MSPIICPTITAENLESYRQQVERVAGFASRLHIDFSDGQFAPTHLVGLDQAWWPEVLEADLHLMFRRPLEALEAVQKLLPRLVIVHAEVEDVGEFMDALNGTGIKKGLAFLQDTSIEVLEPFMGKVDHVLVFSGKLGYHGGEADLALLDKVRAIKAKAPNIEIGWDGGINDQNIDELARAGVSVLNVGGFIHNAKNPESAYLSLTNLL